MGTRRLAARSAVSRSTITRLEAGERRPRASLLGNIAYGLNPDDPAPVKAELVAAAGGSLARESDWSRRARRRALDAAILAGRSPLPERIARPLALHQQADAAHRRAMTLTERPGVWDDAELMEEISRLLKMSHDLSDQAGPPLTVRIGSHEIRAGFG